MLGSRATPAHVPAKWTPVRRQEHAPSKHSMRVRMSRRSLISRRRFLRSTALGAAAAVSAPAVLRAQGAPVRVGILHPVSGALSYSGQQGRIGAQLAVEEINAAGGIKALGGAKID